MPFRHEVKVGCGHRGRTRASPNPDYAKRSSSDTAGACLTLCSPSCSLLRSLLHPPSRRSQDATTTSQGMLSRSTRSSITTAHRTIQRTMATASIIAIDSSTGEPFTSSSSSSNTDTLSQWKHASTQGKPLETRIFYPQDSVIAAVGLGKKHPKTEAEKAERTRKLAATGALAVKDKGAKTVKVDPVWSAHAAAEGAALATFNWVRCEVSLDCPSLSGLTARPLGIAQSLKTKKDSIEKKDPLTFEPLTSSDSSSQPSNSSLIPLTFETGLTFAAAQNLARTLMETPANLLTPTKFCEKISEEFKGLENVELFVRDKGPPCSPLHLPQSRG